VVAEALLSKLQVERTPKAILEAGMLMLARDHNTMAIPPAFSPVDISVGDLERIRDEIDGGFLVEFAAVAEGAGLYRQDDLRSLCPERVSTYVPAFGAIDEDENETGEALMKIAEVAAAALTGTRERHSSAAYGLLTWIGRSEIERIKLVSARLSGVK
jgi:hypothetical protein